MYIVDVEFATINEEPPIISHILQKDLYWVCVCGETNNSFGSISCLHCERLIKPEVIPNILNSPLEATNNDIDSLIMRRKQECKQFHELFNAESLSNKLYMINLEWFLEWKCFVTNDLSEKYLVNDKKNISINKTIGVLPPGPISNNKLINSSNTLKKNLANNTDYILVNEGLWKFFLLNFGGGPEILQSDQKKPLDSNRSNCDIKHKYLNTVESNKVISFEEDENTRQYLTVDLNKNKILMKSSATHYIQETKVDNYIETESIRNDECTVISEGNINEVYNNNYCPRFSNKISEKVEVEVSQKLKQVLISKKGLK